MKLESIAASPDLSLLSILESDSQLNGQHTQSSIQGWWPSPTLQLSCFAAEPKRRDNCRATLFAGACQNLGVENSRCFLHDHISPGWHHALSLRQGVELALWDNLLSSQARPLLILSIWEQVGTSRPLGGWHSGKSDHTSPTRLCLPSIIHWFTAVVSYPVPALRSGGKRLLQTGLWKQYREEGKVRPAFTVSLLL